MGRGKEPTEVLNGRLGSVLLGLRKALSPVGPGTEGPTGTYQVHLPVEAIGAGGMHAAICRSAL